MKFFTNSDSYVKRTIISNPHVDFSDTHVDLTDPDTDLADSNANLTDSNVVLADPNVIFDPNPDLAHRDHSDHSDQGAGTRAGSGTNPLTVLGLLRGSRSRAGQPL